MDGASEGLREIEMGAERERRKARATRARARARARRRGRKRGRAGYVKLKMESEALCSDELAWRFRSGWGRELAPQLSKGWRELDGQKWHGQAVDRMWVV